MVKKKRRIIGVVAAEANSIEQRQILMGIGKRAMSLGYDTAVISNVYNPTVEKNNFVCENRIFELLHTSDLDAVVILSESFMVEVLRKEIAGYLSGKDIPIVILGTYIPEFDLPGSIHINTSDELDLEDITDHLIEKHGFTNIDILTGSAAIEASHLRVNGYRRSLEAHGIEYDDSKVHFGDFWMSSGIELARKYADGKLPMPQAVLCSNDYMAYGLLDAFTELDIAVPEDITVVGYEYVGGRMLHTPILSTYQRNRSGLGEAAVNMIHGIFTGTSYEFAPPKGNFINGESCPCGLIKKQYMDELKAERTKKDYDFWNLFNPLDQKLTECRTTEEFAEACGNYFWQIRNIRDIIFCLSKNWYEVEQEHNDIVSCRSIMPHSPNISYDLSKYDLNGIIAAGAQPSVYYFTPLFFNERLFGHVVLRYDDPDAYDDIFRNWTKAVSNGLEFLRMKNDIKYLTQCQNLSDQRDTLTGMYNENGIRKAYESSLQTGDTHTYVLMLKIGIFDDAFSVLEGKINAVLDAAEAVRQFCGSQNVCGRINDSTFVCIINSDSSERRLADTLTSIVIQHSTYINQYGLDSFLCCACETNGMTYRSIIAKCTNSIAEQQKEVAELRANSHYREMLRIRSHIYLNPQDSFNSDKLQKLYPYSSGHLREIYKKCFGVSIHKDCISARIAKAQFCLAVTPLSMSEIAEKCGYIDYKYFLRQFLATVGVTPNQYRNETM